MKHFSTIAAMILLGAQTAYAQQISADSPQLSNLVKRVNGQDSPTLVGKDLVMGAFFEFFARNIDWSTSDQRIVDEYSKRYSELVKNNQAIVDQSFQDVCSLYVRDRSFNQQNIYSLLAKMASVRQEELARMDALYYEFADSLSSIGRRDLEETAFQDIAPGIGQSNIELSQVATAANENPEMAASLFVHFQSRCDDGSLFKEGDSTEVSWRSNPNSPIGATKEPSAIGRR